uniref:ATP synthase F0 subunit 8 n=1 Tax=Plautia crossota TaxID=355527 RepID=A0A7T8JK35_9HEMI|nr:ATP synthase F0 subunit 8 [Plautia crossota]QQP22166.1 ATP synthase F0 subunit 8 [Plautia crossota]
MAPLWWEILFIMFIMSYITMSIMTYFSFKVNIKGNMKNKNQMKQLNWLW